MQEGQSSTAEALLDLRNERPRDAQPHSPVTGARVSLLKYAPEAVLILVSIAASIRQPDPDLWGHIRFGQEMVSRRHLVLHDPYSYSAFGHLWRNHEWLAEVIMALVYDGCGVVGLKLLKFGCTAATVVFVAAGAAETGASPRLQLLVVGTAATAIAPNMQFRPQLFTFLLFAAMLVLLARNTYRGSAPLWILVPIMAFWTNLHGGFFIGIITLTVYASITIFQSLGTQQLSGQARQLVLLAVAVTLATLLTPYGSGAWLAVIHALRNPVTHTIIEDWQPWPAFVWNGGQVRYGYIFFGLSAFGLIGALAASVRFTLRAGDLPLTTVAAIMSVGGFVANRNMPLAAIACVAPVARHLTLWQSTKGTRLGVERAALFSGTGRWLMFMVAIALPVYTGRLFSNRLRIDTPYPAGAVAFMKQRGLHGNLLSQYDWGEYLIWHMAPSSKVFMDGRYDTVYPDGVFQDYLAFHLNLADAARVLRTHPHDFVLVSPDAKAYVLMEKSVGWKLIYHDQDCALFAPTNSPATKLPGAPFAGKSPGIQYFP